MFKWLEKFMAHGEPASGLFTAAPVKPVKNDGIPETQEMLSHIESNKIVGSSPFTHVSDDIEDKEWVSIDDNTGVITFYHCSTFNCADGPVLCFATYTKCKPIIQGDMFGDDAVVSEWEMLSIVDGKSWTVLEKDVGMRQYFEIYEKFLEYAMRGKIEAAMVKFSPKTVFNKQDTIQLPLEFVDISKAS